MEGEGNLPVEADLQPTGSEIEPYGQGPQPLTCWDLAGRDVVPELTPRGAPRDVGAQVLYALLRADGSPWAPPYERVRALMQVRRKAIEPEREDQADSRLRTYFTLFRGLGFVYEEGGTLRVTPAGHRLAEIMTDMYATLDDASADVSRAMRWKVARLSVSVLSKYQLRSPATETTYPDNADIFPLWAIWRAMRELGSKIHWEEVGRILTKCLRMDDLDAAIDRIRLARESQDYNPDDPESAEAFLGSRCPDLGDDQQDRIIIWLSRAGFKDVLIEHRNRADGFRYLQAEFIPLIDEALASPPVYRHFATVEDYYSFLGEAPADASWGPGDVVGAEEPVVREVVERARSFGDRALIALVGVAGTGKTRAAQMAARILTGGDDSRIEFVQFHAAFTYEEFIGGLAPDETGGGFHREPGVLLRFNAVAEADPDHQYVLVIDELSRADVANVLGELLTYIEYRGRTFTVAALAKVVSLAPNLIVLVTMNPNDRSVINMDDALIRRLRQVEVPASGRALEQILEDAGMRPELIGEVTSWFMGLPSDAPFGHGLFAGVSDEVGLHHVWHEQLRFFLRRGGITTYPNPSAIEAGYKWRSARHKSQGDPGIDVDGSQGGDLSADSDDDMGPDAGPEDVPGKGTDVSVIPEQ